MSAVSQLRHVPPTLFDLCQAVIAADARVNVMCWAGDEASFAKAEDAALDARSALVGALCADTGISVEMFAKAGVVL